MARYSLFMLKVPLNTNQPTNVLEILPDFVCPVMAVVDVILIVNLAYKVHHNFVLYRPIRYPLYYCLMEHSHCICSNLLGAQAFTTIHPLICHLFKQCEQTYYNKSKSIKNIQYRARCQIC